jgi:hypothetical protein
MSMMNSMINEENKKMTNSLSIPTEFCEPRCFVLEPLINSNQALFQAGEYKGKVFGFDLRRAFGREKNRIEARLLHRRLVPFWNIRCSSHFDYSRLNDYQISAHNPDAVAVAIQGPQGQTIEFRVDASGRSEGRVSFTGMERCVTNRDRTEWIESYVQTPVDLPPQRVQEDQKRMSDYTIQNPIPIYDLQEFATALCLKGQKLFKDDLETLVVPPLETADNVVKRMLRKVMVSIDAQTIHSWGLRVDAIDLYFRPLFVFQFEKLDPGGNMMERKLEELDGLTRNRWTNLATTEYQMPTIPWSKILKLSADIGLVLLNDVPVLGQALQITSIVAQQVPGIVDDARREAS